MYTSLRHSSPSKISPSSRRAGGQTEKMASTRSRPAASPPPPLLLPLLTLLTFATTAAGSSVCDSANCGKGHCSELPGIIPNYQCDCDPGWSQAIKFIPMSPCTIPNCTFDNACFNVSLLPPPPGGKPIDICAAVNCGPGGTCKHGEALLSWTCECQPGYVNLLNLTTLPCVQHCGFGGDCSALGLAPPPASSPPSGLAPPGNHDSPGMVPAAPPPSSKGHATALGSIPWQSLLLLLVLLVSMATVQVV